MKRITTLTGPSCAGKSTLESMLAARGALKAISHTTRLPRAGEQQGTDYYFIGQDEFDRTLAAGGFIEHVEFGGASYAMSVKEIERLFALGDDIVIVCEPIGAGQIRDWCAAREDIVLRRVFVDNPQEEINRRFLARFSKDMSDAFTRVVTADRRSPVDAMLDRYAQRLATMMKVENAWRLTAKQDYDIDIERFDASNGNHIADFLMADSSMNPIRFAA